MYHINVTRGGNYCELTPKKVSVTRSVHKLEWRVQQLTGCGASGDRIVILRHPNVDGN